MKKNKHSKKMLKHIAKFHLAFSAGLFVLYLGLSLSYSPEFLLSDIRDKFRAFADDTITVMARVLGPPVQPVVSGSAICNTTNGTLSVALDWADDENSQSFSIERDSLPLVSGLANSSYSDANVAIATSYSYVVTAHGEMGPGIAISDPVVVTTPDECVVALPDPEVLVIQFDGKSVMGQSGNPKTDNRRPTFSGTVNIPNADMAISVHSDTVIFANISANSNGYWSWQPPINISIGSHVLNVVVTDPLDSARTVSGNFPFRIVKKSESSEKDETASRPKPPVVPAQKSATCQPEKETGASCEAQSPSKNPLDFSLTLASDNIFQGKELATKLKILKLDPQYENAQAIIRYGIFDEKGDQKENILNDVVLNNGEVFAKNINIPTFFRSGKYRLRVEIILSQFNVSRGQDFLVLPLPVLNLGGGIIATYPEILSRIGTIALWLLICLLAWLLLFSREYWLSIHALRHITENNLAKVGLLGVKKGKGVSR